LKKIGKSTAILDEIGSKKGQKMGIFSEIWAILGSLLGSKKVKNPKIGPYYRVAPFFWRSKPT